MHAVRLALDRKEMMSESFPPPFSAPSFPLDRPLLPSTSNSEKGKLWGAHLDVGGPMPSPPLFDNYVSFFFLIE